MTLTLKDINFNIAMYGTEPVVQSTYSVVYTGDESSVKVNFNVTDETDLTGATAKVHLYFADSSHIEKDAEIDGTVVHYTLKGTENDHAGPVRVDVFITMNGATYTRAGYKFRIDQSLEASAPLVEYAIETLDTVVKDADEWLAQAQTDFGTAQNQRAAEWVSDNDTRDDQFNAAQASRTESFGQSETARTAAFNTSETGRSNTFTTNENARQAAADANETARNNSYTVAENDREERYGIAESNRSATADADHTRAVGDHNTATDDHGIAESDHVTATADHENYAGLLEDGILTTQIVDKLTELETTYSPRLLSAEQQLEQAGDIFWDTPAQPNTYANTTMTAEQVKTTFFDKYVTSNPHYVTKNLLGLDESGTYQIHEYVFEPKNYEQTIVISSGMHGNEIVPPFALARIVEYMMETPNIHEGFSYLRNKVKLVIIPIVNPWGFNQSPRKYGNVNGINPSRNWADGWDTLAIDAVADEWNKKGTAPFSELETVYLRDVLLREKEQASFYLDCHTSQGWNLDRLLYFLDEDNYLRPQLLNVVEWLDNKIREDYAREPLNKVEETARAKQIYYPQRQMGIPSACVEHDVLRFGGQPNGTEDLTHYVRQLYNYIWHGLKANIRQRINADKATNTNKNVLSFDKTVSGYSDKFNRNWTQDQIIANFYEPLRASDTTYITRASLGKDASGLFDLWKYELTPPKYEKTVLLISGVRGTEFKAQINLMNLLETVVTSNNPAIAELRNKVKFVVVPMVNPWGFNGQAPASKLNFNGVDLNGDFYRGTPQTETTYIKNLITSVAFDGAFYYGSYYNFDLPVALKKLSFLRMETTHDAAFKGLVDVSSAKYGTAIDYGYYDATIGHNDFVGYLCSKEKAFGLTFSGNVLPVRTTTEGVYQDLGGEPPELNLCLDVSLNMLKTVVAELKTEQEKAMTYSAVDDTFIVPLTNFALLTGTDWTFTPTKKCTLCVSVNSTLRSDAATNTVMLGVNVSQNSVLLRDPNTYNTFTIVGATQYAQLPIIDRVKVEPGIPVTVGIHGKASGDAKVRRLKVDYWLE